MQEESQLFEIEKVKNINSNLYSLMKKTISAEKSNLELKNQISATEEDRKNMRVEYSKITTALGLEDKIKKKIKDLDPEVKIKQISVENLKKNLSEIKKNINETRINIENSIVKNSVKKYNEYKTIRLFYADQIQKLIQENSDVQAEIEITAKNPKKISNCDNCGGKIHQKYSIVIIVVKKSTKNIQL